MKSYKTLQHRDNGFTLIVTITMMVLLSLITVGLLSLSSISLRSSQVGSATLEARANARLGLMMAIGALQKHAGPDARLTARADVLGNHPPSGGGVESGTPEALWVGVAAGREDEVLSDGSAVHWLISGLDQAGGSSASPASGFENGSIKMIGDGSVDLARLTGGESVKAGKVPVIKSSGVSGGSFAWFVDDEGLKAQLGSSNPLADNQLNAGRGVLSPRANFEAITEFANEDWIEPTQLSRILSMNDLPLIGADRQVQRDNYFNYTTTSQGVLANSRDGGLKKDLTIAFENEEVFQTNFSETNQEKYLAIDSERLAEASDLQSNGYIHWEMFRQHYRMKEFLQKSSGSGASSEFLDHIVFSKAGLFNNTLGAFSQGQLGPHAMKGSGELANFPYGNFAVHTAAGKNTAQYNQNPTISVLASLQQNAWAEPGATRGARLRTKTQLWTSHFNPYNVSLRIAETGTGNGSAGVRIINFPQAVFRLSSFTAHEGLADKRQSHVNHGVSIEPGRSMVFGFGAETAKGSESDSKAYSEQVASIQDEAVYADWSSATTVPSSGTMDVDFVADRPAFMHGSDQGNGNFEVSQLFFSPMAWESTLSASGGSFPGKKEEISISGPLNENFYAAHALELRTTKEPGSAIRPLIDSNIRALVGNPKWDSTLNLNTLAAYQDNAAPNDRYIQMETTPEGSGYSYMGPSQNVSSGFDRVILFDIPREDLVSLGQLQHANVGRFSYEPSYIVGNSYANPRIEQSDWKTSATDSFSTSARSLEQWAISGSFNLYDASYLVNEILWDEYTFTTIPQEEDNFNGDDVPSNYEELLEGTLLLPNPRYRPYEPLGSSFTQDALKEVGSAEEGSFFHNSGHLLVDGSFNVNSTSAKAWEAFLSGTYQLPVQSINEKGELEGYDSGSDKVRFPRVKASYADGSDGTSNEPFWTGFRELESDELSELAGEIASLVAERGPFFGLGSFVNRKLEPGEEGFSGVLQAALDRTVNRSLGSDVGSPTDHPMLTEEGSQAAGFAGYLLQGDILQALAPYMTTRSDTFKIRSYGESVDKNGNVLAQAWCEAKVQRFPDPVAPDQRIKSDLEELAEPTSPFGRKFRLVSFRWLHPNEV